LTKNTHQNNFYSRLKSFFVFKVILLLLIFCFSAEAQEGKLSDWKSKLISSRLLSIEDGLSSRQVYDIVEDKNGFIWFATNNGLNRYDGKSFRLYTKQNFGLYDNYITKLTIDNKNQLYIQYWDEDFYNKKAGRIQILDLNDYKFKKFENVFSKMPFREDAILGIIADENKELNFIITQPFQLWKYTSDKKFDLLCEMKEWPDTINNISIYYGVLLRNSIFNKKGIVLNMGFSPMYCILNNRVHTVNTSLTPLLFQKDNELLFIDAKTTKFSKLNLATGSDNKLKFIPVQNSERDYVEIKDDQKWAVYPNQNSNTYLEFNGLNGVSISDGKNSYQIIDTSQIIDKSNFSLISSLFDSRGDFWLSTAEGVRQISLKPRLFKALYTHQQDVNIFANQIRGIFQEDDSLNTIYVTAWTNLIVENSKQKFKMTSSNGILYSLLKHNNKIYIGAGQLFELNKAKNDLIKLDNTVGTEIWSLYSLSNDELLMGRTNDIYSYSISSQVVQKLEYASSKIPAALNVYRFVKSKSKGLIAVAENGLFIIKNKRIVDYYGSLAKEKSHYLPVSSIYDLQEDDKGVCWMASSGEGLFRFDWNVKSDSLSAKQFTINDGLASMILYRIEFDDHDNLWIGTYYGLMRFNTLDFTTFNYTVNDGLTHNEFNRVSSFKTSNGKMFFGGLDGLISFDPDALIKNEQSVVQPSFLLLSALKLSQGESEFSDCFDELKRTNKVVFEHGLSVLNLEFQLLDFQKRKHRYAYKIIGVDNDWQYLDENVLRVSGLPYGDYEIQIKAQLASGQWTKKNISVFVEVVKPFYYKLWFFVVVFFLMIVVAYFIFKYRTRLLQKQKLNLELKVANRTIDLKKAVHDKELLLSEVHHRVKNNLQVISGLLELQKDNLKDEATRKAFSEGQSRVNSIALIHHNLYQNEDPGNIEFSSFINDLSSKVGELFDNQNRKVQFELGQDKLYLSIDVAVPLGLIVNELLTNSYKYAMQDKQENKIQIKIAKLTDEEYQLVYRDNGPGLNDKINFENTTTLGLKLVNGLSKQIHGSVKYYFEYGSVFVINFKENKVK
jgi:two-component sensor histidine kinase/ligand-binding sensor domain-containing protein